MNILEENSAVKAALEKIRKQLKELEEVEKKAKSKPPLVIGDGGNIGAAGSEMM